MNVFNTHTCANYAHTYADTPDGASWTAASDEDAPIRLSQMLQLSHLVNVTRQAVSGVSPLKVISRLSHDEPCMLASIEERSTYSIFRRSTHHVS